MAEQTKILLVLPWSPFGVAGAERTVSTLANQLALTYEIKIIALSPAPVTPGTLLNASVAFENIVVPHARMAMFKLARSIRRFSPGIIIGNVSHVSSTLFMAKVLARSPARFVAVNHGTDMSDFIEVAHVYATYFVSSAYVVVSRGIQEALSTRLGLSGSKIRLIYNGLDMEELQRRAHESVQRISQNGDQNVVVGVGRLVAQKSFDVLLRAVRAYRDVYGDRLTLVLIGDGPLAENLRSTARELDIEQQVHFLGWIDNPLPYMRLADVFVLSSYFEGFGNVLIEALACGTPVVSTNCPSGPAEILENGTYGRLVPVGDHNAMAQAIHQTLSAPEPSELLAERAADFSAVTMGQGYRSLIAQLTRHP